MAYANECRPWALYKAIFYQLLGRYQAVANGRRKFRFENKLLSLDASVTDPCATLCDWAAFRRAKGAVKLRPYGRSQRLSSLFRPAGQRPIEGGTSRCGAD